MKKDFVSYYNRNGWKKTCNEHSFYLKDLNLGLETIIFDAEICGKGNKRIS